MIIPESQKRKKHGGNKDKNYLGGTPENNGTTAVRRKRVTLTAVYQVKRVSVS